ncbi:MAG: glycosyltransferase family 9 protein [Oligoflexia bacterium]|nr:glycosyltransferase family 9 protein [Oligoflexia bacterium]
MNILINRSDAIGDTILTLPLAQFIKEYYPSSKVYFLVQRGNDELLKHNPYIDKVLSYDRRESFWGRYKKLNNTFRSLFITHYLYVGGDNFPSWVSFFSGVKFRGGLRNRLNHFIFLNRAIWQRRSQVEMHEGMYNIKLLQTIGIFLPFDLNKLTERIALPLKLTEEEIERGMERVRRLAEEINFQFKFTSTDEYLVIHPGMRGSALNWPAEFYLKLILFIEKNISAYKYIISFTEVDELYITPIKKLLYANEGKGNEGSYDSIRKKIFFMNGEKVGTRAYMALLSKSKLFIGPSTGTTHIANALGVSVVAIYSPIKVQSPKRWGPLFLNNSSERVKIFIPFVDCHAHFKCDRKCGIKCDDKNCMSLLKVESVGNQVLKMLEE